jgi:RHS repeat-associated protein
VGVEYVYGSEWDILLAFDGESSLTNRYLHGVGEDNILADEQFSPTGAGEMPAVIGDLFWMLTDNLGSVRDVVDSDGSNVVNHLTYDGFGQVTSETDDLFNTISGFQGAERDEETGMQLHDRRYYDPSVGRWISEDSIGFAGGDTNVARMVGNGSTNWVDPTGEAVGTQDRVEGLRGQRLVLLFSIALQHVVEVLGCLLADRLVAVDSRHLQRAILLELPCQEAGATADVQNVLCVRRQKICEAGYLAGRRRGVRLTGSLF